MEKSKSIGRRNAWMLIPPEAEGWTQHELAGFIYNLGFDDGWKRRGEKP